MAVAWPAGVNKKVYGSEESWKSNREKVEFKSGRRVYWLKNSSPKKTFAVTMKFDDVAIVSDSKTEWGLFEHWWETTLKGGTLPFTFVNLAKKGTGTKDYYITDEPRGKGQKTKEATFVVEEA